MDGTSFGFSVSHSAAILETFPIKVNLNSSKSYIDGLVLEFVGTYILQLQRFLPT